MYEMTVSFTFNPTAPGVVDTTLPHKIQDQHRMAFMPGQHITAEAGQMLESWATGGSIEVPNKILWDHARRIAYEGTDAFRKYWKMVATEEDKQNLKPILDELKRSADRADKNTTPIKGD